MTYDGPGNVTAVKDTTAGGGAVTKTFTYQSGTSTGTQCGGRAGQVCSATDGRGKITTYAYNTVGDLTAVTPPAPLGKTTITYDTASRVASVTDGKGQTTRYGYDARDRLTKTTYPSSAQRTNIYDDDGNLTGTLDSSQGGDDYVYDALGRETSRTLSGTTTPFTTAYDAVGVLPPSYEPRATGHVPQMVELMQHLVDTGHIEELVG